MRPKRVNVDMGVSKGWSVLAHTSTALCSATRVIWSSACHIFTSHRWGKILSPKSFFRSFDVHSCPCRHHAVTERKPVQACRAGGEQQLGRCWGPQEGGGRAGCKHGPRRRLASLEALRSVLVLSSPGPVRGRRSEGRGAGPDVSDGLMEEGHDSPGGHYATKVQRRLCWTQDARWDMEKYK